MYHNMIMMFSFIILHDMFTWAMHGLQCKTDHDMIPQTLSFLLITGAD